MKVTPCNECGKAVLEGDNIVISKADYDALIARLELQASPEKKLKKWFRNTRSPIAKNPKIARFLLAQNPRLELKELRAKCVAKFGEQSTPSISAMHRFLKEIR